MYPFLKILQNKINSHIPPQKTGNIHGLKLLQISPQILAYVQSPPTQVLRKPLIIHGATVATGRARENLHDSSKLVKIDSTK